MNLSYSYAGGFGAGVNVGEGLAAGVSYNEKSGFGVSAGVAADGVSLMYTENFGKGDVRASHGWQAQLGALEVNYDNLSGYSASLRAASTMFGDTNLKMTSSLTWSEQNGFNGSISYNLLTKEQMAKEAAKNAQKDTQKNQNSLLLNILDGLGFNLGVKEGEPTLFDNIQGAFSGAWHQLTNPLETLGNIGNGFSKLGKGLAGLASDAWDGISGLFGGKKPETGNNSMTTTPDLMRGERNGTFVDESGQIWVTDPKTGNLIPDWMAPNLHNTGSLWPNYPSHENVTEQAGRNAGFSEEEIKILKNGVREVDMPEGYMGLAIMWIKEKLGVDPMKSNDPSLRTHYGPTSFYHNQEQEAGIAPETTKEKILKRVETLLSLAREYESNRSRLTKGESRKIAVGFLGMALHTVQDSFSEAHVVRDRSGGGFGEILQFQIYKGQDHDTHGSSDIYTPNTFSYSASVISSQAVLDMYSSGRSVAEIINYLEKNIYRLSPAARPSGVAPGYEI